MLSSMVLRGLVDSSSSSSRAALSVGECAALLRQWGSAKNLLEGRKLHGFLRDTGQDQDTFLGNLLVQMYGSCGSTDEAYAAFSRISRRNVFSWNILITAFAQDGHLQRAEILFQKMPERDQVSWNVIIAAFSRAGDIDRMPGLLDAMERQGIYPNRLTFVALLDAFDRSELDPSRFSDEGKLLHSKISQHGFHFDLQIQTALIKMYDRLGSVEKAIAVFDRISSPDAIAWNSLLSAFARNGDLDAANALFQRMPERSLVSWNIAIAANLHCGRAKTALWLLQVMDLDGGDTADRAIFITALYACGVLEELRLGEAIHAEIAASGLETDVCIGTALISMYGKCHRALLARHAFDRIKEKNQVAWNAMITAYTQNGRFDLARGLFDLMPGSDVVSWTLMLTEFVQKGLIREAREIFDRIPVRDTASWNAMISAHAGNGESLRAIELLAKMDLEGFEADRATFIGVLASHFAPSEARLLQDLISSSGCRSDSSVATALVSMHGRSARLATAREIFDATREKNVVLWSATIGIYADNGLFDAAMELFFRMCLEGVHPNDVTFVSILSASAHAGDLSNARQWFFSVATDFGVAYTRDHYVCMADMLARSGLMDQARELVGDMPFVPDSCSWKTVLAGCLVAGSLKQAERVACSVIECEPEDSSSYIMLSNIYSAAKDQILV
ncbi:pentatricopeptide repeat-containing protein At4g02750 isoform X1 [Selaginella moellendorffii]|uniref:pentatricopeptide repeat-containing protein At4g02750 isoform X1 n=1 Tax=Selaginella moellendorffii TaxID=88036 RepID=UPI000D1C8B6D|nr:pentatricopeptide repeat-containing protein At4g02750 isoform X1 [Selaginella moellendorffii]|eukprot:XP_024531887.1 pentatricopeptide repeat-containing protein At4g02750 isoform X1 [Selaginella moellendorffii]